LKTGRGISDKIADKTTKSGVAGGPWVVDFKKGFELLTQPGMWKMTHSKKEESEVKKRVAALKRSYDAVKRLGYKGSYNSFVLKIGAAKKPTFTFPGFGGGIDIHKAIGKLPKPKSGWTLPGHKYTGPYNDLENQLKYDPKTGQILEIYDTPTGPTDYIAMQHDVDYSVCKDGRKCKNKADRKMVQALDNVPYNERQWGHWLARNVINTKQKLGLGLKTKNGKSRRVKKADKKN